MDEFESEAVEIIAGRFYFTALRHADAISRSKAAAAAICYCIDQDLLYEPFYADFGPLNLGKTYRFCEITARLLQEAEQRGKRLYLFCGTAPQQRANASVLVGAFQVLLLGRDPDAAFAPLARLKPFLPFRDASCGAPCFLLQIQDCLRGLHKAAQAGFLDARGGVWRFDIDEYEHYEQVENGDLNWVVPGKLLAFSGPAARPTEFVGFRSPVPEDYLDYFRRRRVAAVVRLNKKAYDRRRFTDAGLRHHELYFPDGSCPPTDLLLRFLDIAEQEPGALAVHCKAGLGRTGVLICAYMMKHYRFTAEEVIGYIRIVRPGSVIGPQQNHLKEIQPLLWREGDAWRAAHGPAPPALAWGPAPPSRAGAVAAAGLEPRLALPRAPSASAAFAAPPSPAAAQPQPQRAASGRLAEAAAAAAAARAPLVRQPASSGGAAATASAPSAAFAAAAAAAGAGAAGGRAVPVPVPAARAPGDLSLMQYVAAEQAAHAQARSHPAHAHGHLQLHSGFGAAASAAAASSSVAAAAAAYLGPGSAHAASARPPSGPRGRAPTPSNGRAPSPGAASDPGHRRGASAAGSLRGSSRGSLGGSLGVGGGLGGGFGGSGSLSGAFSVLKAGGATANGPLSAGLLLSRPASHAVGARPADHGAAHGRSPSAPRERGGGGAAGLRATLPTDTVDAAARQRAVPDRPYSLSSEFYSDAWRSSRAGSLAASTAGAAAAAAAAQAAAAAASRPRSNIVRVLAPNGQPRKVPASALLAGGGGAAGAGGGRGLGGGSGGSLLLPAGPPARTGSHTRGYAYPN
ncbi:hypothetical protein Rsub_01067 [Raphidocelis subcapitata]|uniref:protein-tyrosine-phosphatase n=1 Tax=Raphidocelis subcapitata TaxID=307507 RepID=A0A2V0NU46_9CHLO|nr:hypothetical protein Rsub_01067 [Raphidocelis subcapitata]|eukprot:GBF88355.1 hypothetical protein Rsub_01067 [Raphidocelis subcapitata]